MAEKVDVRRSVGVRNKLRKTPLEKQPWIRLVAPSESHVGGERFNRGCKPAVRTLGAFLPIRTLINGTFGNVWTHPVQAAFRSSAEVTVQGVEALPEGGLVDGGVQHLQRQRVAPGVLPVVQLRRRAPASAVAGGSIPVLIRAGAHLRAPHSPAVVEGGVNAVSRNHGAVLRLPRVGVEAGGAHPVSGWGWRVT